MRRDVDTLSDNEKWTLELPVSSLKFCRLNCEDGSSCMIRAVGGNYNVCEYHDYCRLDKYKIKKTFDVNSRCVWASV